MKQIQLTNSDEFFKISDCDIEKIKGINWILAKRRAAKYVCGNIKGKQVLLHRFLLEISDRRNHVDHINRDGLDNTRENLRICSLSENNRNKGVYKNNVSGIKGVSALSNGKYMARIVLDKKFVYLGCYKTAEEASERYNIAAKELFGEYADTSL